MASFKLRKNKKFDYEPRYYENNGEGSKYEFKGKFDEYRTTLGTQGGIKSRFRNAFAELRKEQDKSVNRRMLIIIGVLLLIFLFIIDFDLSIFSF
jgi:hypothetical protein